MEKTFFDVLAGWSNYVLPAELTDSDCDLVFHMPKSPKYDELVSIIPFCETVDVGFRNIIKFADFIHHDGVEVKLVLK